MRSGVNLDLTPEEKPALGRLLKETIDGTRCFAQLRPSSSAIWAWQRVGGFLLDQSRP